MTNCLNWDQCTAWKLIIPYKMAGCLVYILWFSIWCSWRWDTYSVLANWFLLKKTNLSLVFSNIVRFRFSHFALTFACVWVWGSKCIACHVARDESAIWFEGILVLQLKAATRYIEVSSTIFYPPGQFYGHFGPLWSKWPILHPIPSQIWGLNQSKFVWRRIPLTQRGVWRSALLCILCPV